MQKEPRLFKTIRSLDLDKFFKVKSYKTHLQKDNCKQKQKMVLENERRRMERWRRCRPEVRVLADSSPAHVQGWSFRKPMTSEPIPTERHPPLFEFASGHFAFRKDLQQYLAFANWKTSEEDFCFCLNKHTNKKEHKTKKPLKPEKQK